MDFDGDRIAEARIEHGEKTEPRLHPLFAKLTRNFVAAAGVGVPEKNEVNDLGRYYK
jgi:hypothetical protein